MGVTAYRRNGVRASARDARAESSLGALPFQIYKIRERAEKFWAGSSQGHYADTPSRPHADTRLLLAPKLITAPLITDYFWPPLYGFFLLHRGVLRLRC